MPETMSPREKVELKPCPFCGSSATLERDTDHHGGWFNLGCGAPWKEEDACPGYHAFYTCDPSEEIAAVAAWNRRAALASSGDHAPVAWRVKDFADGWIVCGFEQTAIDLAIAMSGAAVQPLYDPAVIAENAALRAQSDFYKRDNDVLMKNAWVSRATEAERKLAEAEEALELAAVRFDEIYEAAEIADIAYQNEATIHGINANADVAQSEIRTFLSSKEAERG